MIVEHLGDNGDDAKAIHDSVVVRTAGPCDVERREAAGGGEIRGGDRFAAARDQRANGVGRGDGRGLLERGGVAAAPVTPDKAVGLVPVGHIFNGLDGHHIADGAQRRRHVNQSPPRCHNLLE